MQPSTTTNASARSRRPRVALACLCAAVGWSLAIGAAQPAGAVAGLRQTGIDGGGFVNVIAADPSGSGVVIAGGDVSGLHRSTDFGDTWTQVNTGITGIDQLKVASVAFSPSTPGEVFAAVGDEGRNGGVLVSDDGGLTWELRSTVLQFSGGNNDGWPGLPQKHPRSTGRLFAFDPGRDLVYAATFEHGVYRSADHGYTWTPLGASGRFLRGIAIDPSNPDVLYVAAYGEGIFKTTDAAGLGAFAELPSSPARPEELVVVGSGLYAAAGPAGIFASTNGGANWSRLGGDTVPTGPMWMSIDGYRACGQTMLYAGSDHGDAGGVIRSMDGGATWVSLVGDPTRMHDEIGGAGGPHWWMYRPNFVPGGSYYTASSIALDPSPPPAGECLRRQVLLAGRSGIWRATDGGADWYPAVSGLGVSIARALAFDPTAPSRLSVAMVDWVHVSSQDGGDTVTQRRPGGGATGFDVEYLRTSPPRVFVASGSSTGNTGGEVYSAAAPLGGGWTDEGLSTVAQGARPLAIGVRQVGTQRVLIVATEGDGIWRKAGGVWTQVSTATMQGFQGTHSASLVWPPGPFVYLFDHDSGIWRSANNGKTWTRIWTRRSGSQLTGFLAVDPRVPDRLYVSAANQGVFRIDNADSGSGLTGHLVAVPLGAFAHPGAIAVDPSGVLYVATLAQGGPAQLYRSDDLGATFTEVTDPVWAGSAGFVFDLQIAPDGQLYAATAGDGVIHGSPGVARTTGAVSPGGLSGARSAGCPARHR
jgi:hypothetical protein